MKYIFYFYFRVSWSRIERDGLSLILLIIDIELSKNLYKGAGFTQIARGLCVLRSPRMRLGLPWRIFTRPLQQLARQMHQVHVLRPILLAE